MTMPNSLKKLTPVKIAILEENLTQRRIAKMTGINEGWISLVCNGRAKATPIQEAKIAAVVGRREAELFPAS
jgi:transcriptional regulator with XRE-family HTH domain